MVGLGYWDPSGHRELQFPPKGKSSQTCVFFFLKFKKPMDTTKGAWVVSLGIWLLSHSPQLPDFKEGAPFTLTQEEYIVGLCLTPHCSPFQKHGLSSSSLNSSVLCTSLRAPGTLDRSGGPEGTNTGAGSAGSTGWLEQREGKRGRGEV